MDIHRNVRIDYGSSRGSSPKTSKSEDMGSSTQIWYNEEKGDASDAKAPKKTAEAVTEKSRRVAAKYRG